MKVVWYDKENCISTIKISDEDLSLIVSVFGGLSSTWSVQDSTILGLTKERFEKLEKEVRAVFFEGKKIE